MARLNRALARSEIRGSVRKRLGMTAIALCCRRMLGVAWTGLVGLYLTATIVKLRRLVIYSIPTAKRTVNFLSREVNEYDFNELFRFHKVDFYRLATAFQIPQHFKLPKGGTRPRIICFLYMLWRAAYPTTYLKDELMWGEGRGTLCEMFNLTMSCLFNNWALYLVRDLDIGTCRAQCRRWAAVISRKGAPLERCWGFIDGTIRETCRPVRGQRGAYNGWKKLHGVKYQSIETPDGLMRQVWGPLLCRRNDNFLLAASQLIPQLREHFNSADGLPYYLYGDPAYPKCPWMLRPYKGNLTAAEREFNRRISSVRETVEWGFAKVVANWGFVDFVKQQKIRGSACGVGKQYCVAALLTNCHTCVYGSEVSSYFDCTPPVLEEYINGHA